MRVSRRTLRLLSAGAVLLGTLTATPASAQTADLAVTLTVASGGITFAEGTTKYTVAIKNNGPSDVSSVALAATLPTQLGASLDSVPSTCTSTSTLVACTIACSTDADGNQVFPCTINDIPNGATVTTSFTLALPALATDADENPILPTACPSPTALGNTSVQVSSGATDPNPANNAATVANEVRPLADLSADLTGPSSAKVGDTVTFTAVITNNGPCVAGSAVVDFTPAGGLLFQSGEGACATTDECVLGDMNPGASVTFTTTYKVDKLPENFMSTGNPNSITVSSTDPATGDSVTDDPIDSNNSAFTATFVQTGGGCSSGGGPVGLVALAGLAALAVVRRRFV